MFKRNVLFLATLLLIIGFFFFLPNKTNPAYADCLTPSGQSCSSIGGTCSAGGTCWYNGMTCVGGCANAFDETNCTNLKYDHCNTFYSGDAAAPFCCYNPPTSCPAGQTNPYSTCFVNACFSVFACGINTCSGVNIGCSATTPTPTPTSTPTPTPTSAPTCPADYPILCPNNLCYSCPADYTVNCNTNPVSCTFTGTAPTPTPTIAPGGNCQFYGCANPASITETWSQPNGYVSATGLLGVTATCSGKGSCSMGFLTFGGFEQGGYTVRANSSTGSILKTGTFTAAGNGSASFSWTMGYEFVYCELPDNTATTCAFNPTAVVVSQTSTTGTIPNPLPFQWYHWEPWAPDQNGTRLTWGNVNAGACINCVSIPTSTPTPTPRRLPTPTPTSTPTPTPTPVLTVSIQGRFVSPSASDLTTNIGQNATINGISVNLSGFGAYYSNPLSPPGSYSITATPISNYTISYCIRTINNVFQKECSRQPGNYTPTNSVTVNLPSNGNWADIYFMYAPTYTISGNVFVDNGAGGGIAKDGLKNGAEGNYILGTSTIQVRSGGCSGTLIGSSSTGTGAFSISNIPAGTYAVCYTSLPSGYRIINPTTGPPPYFSKSVGPSVPNVDYAILPYGPWIQSTGTDIRIDPGFNDPVPLTAIPACGGPYASIPGSGSAPGIIFTGNSNPFYLGQPGYYSSASTTNWVVGGSSYPEVYTSSKGVISTSYSYVSSIAKQAGLTATDVATYCTGGINSCNLSASIPHGLYIANGNLKLIGGGYTFPINQNYVILVNGDLTISEQIHVPVGSTATFIVGSKPGIPSGNIYVDKTVGESVITSTAPDIEGFYSADNSFIVQSLDATGTGLNCPTSDLRLNVAGTVVVNAARNTLPGSFQNQRDLCGGDPMCPAFSINARADFILNSPQVIKKPNLIFQELAP